MKKYFANFRISHTIHAIPPELFPRVAESLRPSMVIAQLAMEAYVNDVVKLVSSGVTEKISALEQSDQYDAITFARALSKDLKVWLGCKHPLDYSSGVALIRIVVAGPDETSLPPSSCQQLNIEDFCSMLIKVHAKPQTSGLPFVTKGQFQHILPIAVKRIITYGERLSTNPRAYAIAIFKHVILAMRIYLVPWSPPRTGLPGRPVDHPVFNAWTTLGAPSPNHHSSGSLALRPVEQLSAARKRSIEELQASDINAPWTATVTTIQELHKFLNRRALPTDFVMPEFSGVGSAQYVKDTYIEVSETIDLDLPLHHLALLLAIIFSCLCPNVYTSPPKPIDVSISQDFSTSHHYLSTLPWVNRLAAGKKGNTRRNLYISMVTIYILALYNPESRLRKYHRENGQLGRAWTDKHSKLLAFSTS